MIVKREKSKEEKVCSLIDFRGELKEVVIVVATKKNQEEFRKTTLINRFKGVRTIEVVYENSEGLGTVYNRFIQEEYRDCILLFIHDDVIINDINLVKKLNMSKFDITGVAGSQSFDTQKQPVTWSNASRNKLSGAVEHPTSIDAGEEEMFRTFVYGSCPRQCIVIDGLFIAVKTDKLLDSGVRFDERFKFHFYDLDFSLNAHLKKLKVGVVSLSVTHLSHGGYMSKSWLKAEAEFREKYKDLDDLLWIQ